MYRACHLRQEFQPVDLATLFDTFGTNRVEDRGAYQRNLPLFSNVVSAENTHILHAGSVGISSASARLSTENAMSQPELEPEFDFDANVLEDAICNVIHDSMSSPPAGLLGGASSQATHTAQLHNMHQAPSTSLITSTATAAPGGEESPALQTDSGESATMLVPQNADGVALANSDAITNTNILSPIPSRLTKKAAVPEEFLAYMLEEVPVKCSRFRISDAALLINALPKLTMVRPESCERKVRALDSLVRTLIRKIDDKTHVKDLALLAAAVPRLGDGGGLAQIAACVTQDSEQAVGLQAGKREDARSTEEADHLVALHGSTSRFREVVLDRIVASLAPRGR